MDMKRIRRQHPSLGVAASPPDPEDEGAFRTTATAYRSSLLGGAGILRLLLLVTTCLTLVLLLSTVSGSHRNSLMTHLDRLLVRTTVSSEQQGSENDSLGSARVKKDKLLGGLLAPGFNENSCLSRYRSPLYRKQSSHLLSPYLLERLRKHETLQKKCGPKTESYNKAIEQLKSGHSIGNECNYVVWISYSGLGNQMLSIASTFLYALLTNRVFLIDRGVDMTDLFCEPFPESSWLLPSDFPINHFNSFNIKAPESYGNMLKDKVIHNSVGNASRDSLPAYVYLHLSHDYNDYDKLFFCEDDQRLLQNIPWLLLRSNNYFVPSLFLIPAYEEELTRLFPQKDTVFHHLGRYLFHPTNIVWGLITRYFESYLANAEERMGIQIRVFDSLPGPFQYVMDQILACSLKEKLLPDVNRQDTFVLTTNVSSKSVLITSLNSGYYEKIRNMYWEHPAATGEIISVHQPSHEGYQQTEQQLHNRKAWAEIYLLSLTDVLVTSAWSTFGYVAQGLGGLKPWILFKPENETVPDPPCRQAMSMEPCFHAPPFYDCQKKTGTDTGELVPYIRHCEDMGWGLKVVNREEW